METLLRRILKRLPWAGLLLAAASAGANTLVEYAPVLSVTPAVQPVAVQRQACSVDGHCGLLTFHETRTTGYTVVYLYEGREHTVQLPYDPGTTLALQVDASRLGVAGTLPSPVIVTAPVYVPAPVVIHSRNYYPYAPYTVYPSIGLHLQLGRGHYHHRYDHRHYHHGHGHRHR
ncbi:MAG TPA: hypothetical protein DDX06_06125 [Curvibacter sp.]|nr:hypothetical protein [Curvibacter sp.]